MQDRRGILEAFMANRIRPHVLGSFAVMALFSAAAIASPAPQGQDQSKDAASRPLAWAYAVQEPAPPPPPPTDDAEVRQLPGSTQSFTMKQIRDTGNPVDWFPGDHPPMPTIVAHRRSPNANPWIGSCGLCHYPNGKGRPENAGVAGLPAGYILEQLADFKNGARKTADPGKRNTAVMAGNAGGITDEEAKAAADYFASMKMTPWIKVVETETIPKSKNMGGFFVPLEGAGTEPIGQRIVEMPVDPEATEKYRNPRSGWIAYAPMGSIKRGEDLVVKGGAGKTVSCAACHGDGLKGNGNFPPLAGRSPSYLARQLYDIQRYTRNGPGTQLMRPVVQNLNEEDILNIAAYLASLEP
jgi:cytochrome c553